MDKQKKSLTVNSIMNTLKTLMSLIFPLITYPYALRVLGVDNIGRANFANSIVSYFVLLAGLGINRYAIREGARKRDNAKEFCHFANQMFTINLISTIIAYFLLACLVVYSKKIGEYATLIFVYSLTIFGTTMGMDWINSAQEEYIFITIRTVLFQFVSMILLFILVKNEQDITKYAIVSVFASVGANVCNFFYVRKYADVKLCFRGITHHIAPIMWLFASAVATTIYVNSDTTMLGLFSSDYNVGLYGVATKLYTIVKQILAAAIVVTLPRLSNYWAHGLTNEFKKTVSGVFDTFMILLFPMMTGMFILAPQAIEIIGGNQYLEGVSALRILSISLCFSIFGTFYTNSILLPMKKEKEVTLIMLMSAVINLGLNFIFIPLYKQNGAAFTTAIAEFCVMIMQMYVVRGMNIVEHKRKLLFQVVIGCMVMGTAVFVVSMAIHSAFWGAGCATICGIFVYCLCLLVMKNEFACSVKDALLKRTHRGV